MTLCRTVRVVIALLLLELTVPAISQDRLDDVRASGAHVLQVGVPFEPTAFPSHISDRSQYELVVPDDVALLRLKRVDVSHTDRGKPGAKGFHVAYELVLTSISSAPLALQRVEIADGSGTGAQPVAVYEGPDLEALLAFPDREAVDRNSNRLQLQSAERVVVNLFLSFQDKKSVPRTVRHKVYTTDTRVVITPMSIHHAKIPVLGPPLRGGNWFVLGGPGASGITKYHRQNTFMFNGAPEAARRYAIDWLKVENGEMRSGALVKNDSYYGYGQEILAVADGVITNALDGVPENIPGHAPPLAPMTPSCLLCGNHVVLKLAQGQFATYMHVQPGSLRVAKGDRVRRGQVLGLVGNSGDSYLPHLHFHVATEPGMTGQGVPYLIDRFSIIDLNGNPQPRTRELPLDGRVIDFGS